MCGRDDDNVAVPGVAEVSATAVSLSKMSPDMMLVGCAFRIPRCINSERSGSTKDVGSSRRLVASWRSPNSEQGEKIAKRSTWKETWATGTGHLSPTCAPQLARARSERPRAAAPCRLHRGGLPSGGNSGDNASGH